MATIRQQEVKGDEHFSRYVEENPFKPGVANARLMESGMAIWAFAGALEAAENNPVQMAHDYELSPEQVEAAIAYYQRYKEIIDDRRAANRLSATLYWHGSILMRISAHALCSLNSRLPTMLPHSVAILAMRRWQMISTSTQRIFAV